MMAPYISSSGSQHNSLSFLVNEFLENGYSSTVDTSCNDSGDESESDSVSKSNTDRAKQASEEIKNLLDPSFVKNDRLYFDVKEAIQGLESIRENKSKFRRAVMIRLREKGYDSGLCKVKWEGSKGVVKGNYEYIDVVEINGGKEERYIIDVGFAAEFEVVGPTDEYRIVSSALPEVLVARQDELRRVLHIMADESKRSLKIRGLSVPPWRKPRFLMAKWIGSYKRTLNPVSESLGNLNITFESDVKCRKIGFFLPQNLGSILS